MIAERESEALLLSARETFVRRPRDRAKPDEIDQLVGRQRVLVICREESDCPFCVHDRIDAASLQEDADSSRESGVIGPGVEVEDPHAPAVGPAEAFQRLNCRRLAGSVGAEQSYYLAGVCVKAEAVDRDEVPVTNYQAIDLHSGHRREAIWAPCSTSSWGVGAEQRVGVDGSATRGLEPVAEAAKLS